MIRSSFVAVLLSLSVIFLSLPPSDASADLKSRPGTVADTLSLPDGAKVLLDGMLVVQVNGPYIFVRDPWPGCSLLPVYANAKLEKWWSVEITGMTKTISGKRIVVAARIRLYVDSKGRPFWNWPKGLEPREWRYMTEVPIGISTMTEPPPPPDPEPAPTSSPPEPDQYTVAWALQQPVGSQVEIRNVICTADTPPATGDGAGLYDFGAYLYVQEPDLPEQQPNHGRSAGIRVNSSSGTFWGLPVHRGYQAFYVTGTISVSDGEKQIDATAVYNTAPNPMWPPAKPLGMNNRAIGGNGFGDTPGVKDPEGLYNKGLLIRTWGTVTYVDPSGTFCYIDDGSSINGQWLNDGNTLGPGGTAVLGVRVLLARQGPGWLYEEVPQVGQFLVVTGISSSIIINNQPVRMVRQLINFGRVVSQVDTNTYDIFGGRGLMTTDAGDTYFTLYYHPQPSLTENLLKYQPGLPPIEYPIGHVLGCLDLDNDGTSFWGGLYRPLSGLTCRLYEHSLVPPFEQLQEVPINWLPADLDGLAVAPDGTLWISGDLATRVYHVARDGTELLPHFDTAFPVSGHEYVNGRLWLASIPDVQVANSRLYKVDLSGNVLAYFNVPDLDTEDLDWRPADPNHLRGLDNQKRRITTWDLTGLEVMSQ